MEGIPYMGSKRKLAHRIVDVIFNRHNSEKFYDLFGGGGLFRQTAVSCCFFSLILSELENILKILRKEFASIKIGCIFVSSLTIKTKQNDNFNRSNRRRKKSNDSK